MPPRHKERLTAKVKREQAARMKLDGHTLQDIVAAGLYTSTGSASQAISEYLRQAPPEDIQDKREVERLRLESMRHGLLVLRLELMKILTRRHVVVQHGKVVGRFAGWQTDPENPAVLLRDNDGKPIATYEEVEDDEPSIRVIAELRQNTAELRKISESLRRLGGLDAPVRIRIEDDEGIDEEIEGLVNELLSNQTGPPAGHDG